MIDVGIYITCVVIVKTQERKLKRRIMWEKGLGDCFVDQWRGSFVV